MSELQVPPELARIAAFVNTVDLESGADSIDSPAGLAAWLAEQRLIDDAGAVRVTAEEVAGAAALREALRSVLRANDGHPVDAGEVTRLNRELQSLSLHIQFNTDGWPVVAPVAHGVNGALARLVAGIATSVAAGTWRRVKVCASDTCQWAFYDHSRNRSGRWCSMRVCGNRSKIRTYRSGRAPG